MDGAKIPPVLANDREALCVAIKTCNRVSPEQARVVRIRNTKSLHFPGECRPAPQARKIPASSWSDIAQ